MSLFNELKRRNVFRVGIAYAVGAWLLLQLTDVLSELLDLPQQFGPIVVAVVAIGFPIALIFAWAFELTPEGVKRESEVDRTQSITPQTGKKLNTVIIVMLAVALAYFIWESRFAERGVSPDPALATVASETPPEPSAPEPVVASINPRSIAVLPFDNRSDQKSDEYFVEGIHDDLLTNLARIGSLKVISRTSVLRFKDTQLPIPQIAGELGVATVLEGAVQRAGETVRINVQLIDAQTDEHLWAEIFDREMTTQNLFAIQTEISQAIAAALETTLSPGEQKLISDRPTDNLAAYNAYLRGRQLLTRRNSEELQQALAEFQRAVELDPQFALAWVGVAEAAKLLPGYSAASQLEMLAIQDQAAQRALAINDQLGEAHLAMAEVHVERQQYDEAERAYKQAISLSPNYPSTYQWYADYIARWPARLAEALELTRKAVELDPLAPILQMELAEKLNALGRFDEAETQLRKLFELDPGFAPAYSMMATVKGNTGRLDEQLYWQRKSYELNPGGIWNLFGQAQTLLELGDNEGVRRLIEAMSDMADDHPSIGFMNAMLAMRAENFPAALEQMRWAFQKMGDVPGFKITEGFMHIGMADYPAARSSFELGDPRFSDRAQWRPMLEEQNGLGCIYAWLLLRTGAYETGQQLLAQALDYMQNELPRYVDHPDRYGIADCLAINGDLEAAMDGIEQRLAHGHIAGWWFNNFSPWLEPLRGTPRFMAVEQELEARLAQQRENVARMEAASGAMSFFAELKRRNVIKVAAAYAIVGWLVMQVGEVMAPALQLPGWVLSTLAFFIILGFPLALVFAWAFEMTPEGIKREKDVDRSQSITRLTSQKLNNVITGLLVLALGYFAFDKFVLDPERDAELVATTRAPAAAEPAVETQAGSEARQNSIAVLPFVNMSDDASNEYFSDGLSEELLNLLAKIPELRVAARTSSFSFKDQNVEIPKIAERLGVAHVLEGSVRKAGTQLRITAQLIRADNGFHLWSETYDRELENIFEIQDEIAANVVDALKVTLLGTVPRNRETDPEAYRLYLEGQHFFARRSRQDIARAVELFQQALEIDPTYAPAWADLSYARLWMGATGMLPPAEIMPLAAQAAERALDLDPHNSQAHIAKAVHRLFYQLEFEQGLAEYRRAWELDPGSAMTNAGYGIALRNLGRMDEAVQYQRRSIELDPLNPELHNNYGRTLEVMGRFDEAEASFRKTRELSPGFAGIAHRLSRLELLRGNYQAALAEAQAEQESSTYGPASLSMAWHSLGDAEASDRELARMIEQDADVAAYQIAETLAWRGETERALDWLYRCMELRDSGLASILGDPLLASLWGEPRWEQLLRELGLWDAWQAMPPEWGGPQP